MFAENLKTAKQGGKDKEDEGAVGACVCVQGKHACVPVECAVEPFQTEPGIPPLFLSSPFLLLLLLSSPSVYHFLS